jgi:hypothetical protein
MEHLILVLLGIGFLVFWVVLCVIDGYKHPTCPLCRHNLFCKRVDGKILCEIHGDITEALEIA